MKAVFVTSDCLYQTAEPSGEGVPDALLPEAVVNPMRRLDESQLLIVVLDPGSGVGRRPGSEARGAGDQVGALRRSGISIDALLRCPHKAGESCACWGTHPGFLQVAAAQLDLRLNECYLLCTQPSDVTLAQYFGCRPLLVLGKRTVGEMYGGHSPESHDFPIARSLDEAVSYLLCEEDADTAWDHPRLNQPLPQPEELAQRQVASDQLPLLELFSPVPGAPPWLAMWPQWNRRIARFLLTLIVGGVWLSLGIAYMLTHLYRVQQFPAFVWYLTLQFIPRPLRGALFIGTGIAVVALSLRAFKQLLQNARARA